MAALPASRGEEEKSWQDVRLQLGLLALWLRQQGYIYIYIYIYMYIHVFFVFYLFVYVYM